MKTILLFGDSLTEGYYNYGTKFHPYSIRLGELLTNDYIIENHGVSGETSRMMVPRFQTAVSNNVYKYAVILGGTNDMGDRDPKGTFRNLKSMYIEAKSRGIETFAVTVPENHQERNLPWLTGVRETINNLIKEYCEQNGITVIDLCTKLPQLSLSPEDKDLYWDDGLHFTPEGYNKFADIVYESIRPKLE